jgi:carboxypeptidase C (cathepsin A)
VRVASVNEYRVRDAKTLLRYYPKGKDFFTFQRRPFVMSWRKRIESLRTAGAFVFLPGAMFMASLIVSILLLAACPAKAVERVSGDAVKTASRTPGGNESKEEKKQFWDQKPSVTHNSVQIAGNIVKYAATSGYLPLSDDAGKPQAYIFFTAYEKEGEPDKTRRPITFAFNGGPGAASVWLHMAAIGPRRVLLTDDGKGLPPPYKWVPNEEAWLDLTDLVFIDPAGTGFSRLAEGVKPEEFYGVKKDIESMAQFIRRYCTRYDRWLSPKLLAGESYGTTRAAGLSRYLQNSTGMALNGLILISTALNFQTINSGPENDLGQALSLPAYTLTAAYHGRLSPALQADIAKTREEAERFALGEYLLALTRGHTLSAAEREAIVEKLAAYTGLRKTSIRNSNLRIGRGAFARQLLEEKNLRVGLYDSRFTAHYRHEQFMDDPSMFQVTAPMLAAFHDYVKRELKYESDLPYEFLSEKVNRAWNWGSANEGYVDMTTALAQALSQNGFLKVFVASGYYDLVTTYFAAKYIFDRMGPDSDLRAAITHKYYDGGHQLYMDNAMRKKLKADVAGFFKTTVSHD